MSKNSNNNSTSQLGEKLNDPSSADGDDSTFLEPVKNKPEDTVSSLMRRILMRSGVALVALGVVAAVVGGVAKGTAGFAAALVAIVILLVFCLSTPAAFAVFAPRSQSFTRFAACIAVSWFIKIVVIVVAFIALKSATWFDHNLFAIFVVVGAAIFIVIETHAVLTARLAYVPKKN